MQKSLIDCQLCETGTRDGLVHQGIFRPGRVNSGYGILWVHGLTSAFYHNFPLIKAVTAVCDKNGYGYASFNNRGHDCLTGLDKISNGQIIKTAGGAGVERFEDCVYDIDAGIKFLNDRGYKKVIIIGHSTGALKAAYYAGVKKDVRVAGIVAASPTSDRLIEVKNNRKLPQILNRMKHMIEIGKGDYILNNIFVFPMTPKRYVSLFDEHSAEETVFDYGSARPDTKILKAIRVPLLVTLAENDEYADRPVVEIKAFIDKYQNSRNYKSVIISNAVHGYDNLEPVFIQTVIHWIKSINP